MSAPVDPLELPADPALVQRVAAAALITDDQAHRAVVTVTAELATDPDRIERAARALWDDDAKTATQFVRDGVWERVAPIYRRKAHACLEAADAPPPADVTEWFGPEPDGHAQVALDLHVGALVMSPSHWPKAVATHTEASA